MHRSHHRYQADERRSDKETSALSERMPLTLAEAQLSNAFVVLTGEYGGSTYLVASAHEVRCTQDQLEDILAMLDKADWNDFRNAAILYVNRPLVAAAVKGHHVRVDDRDIWIADSLLHLAGAVLIMMDGERVGGC